MSIVFSAFSPHPPILLPSVGNKKDRNEVKKTIQSLEVLGKKLKKINPDLIIISSPHPDWGFNVPLFFLANNLKSKVESYLIGSESPDFYFEKGKKFYQSTISNLQSKIALIASGDLSHCLKANGPYGFNPQGPKFDKNLIDFLKNKNTDNFLKLDNDFPEAGECGLRSFSFILGILEESKINWQPEILSYEGPFGVGYLVADFKLKNN
jgi:aromatic ring-opening dioxygenase LigB subunit